MIKEFKKRRNERYEAMVEKLCYFSEKSRFYEDKEGVEILSKIMKMISKNTETEIVNLADGDNKKILCSKKINIAVENYEEYIDKIISAIRELNENYIEIEIRQTRKKLEKDFIEDNIENIQEKDRKKYLDAVKHLVALDKIGRINYLEGYLEEIKKDMISCLKYNDKINKIKNVDMVNV